MTRPNFLILQADQLTAQVLGAYGRPLAKTPHIDRMAQNGVVFRNSYCTVPLCGPSRMSMMTGRLASRIGAFDNGAELRSEIPTFAHYLRALGYRTTLSGKMHFVGADQLHGFEERLTTDIYPADFLWTENLETRDAKNTSDDRGVTLSGICDRSVQLDYDELAMYHAEQRLWDYARETDGRPFCLFVSLTHPHDPYYCTQEHYDRYSDNEVPLPSVARLPHEENDPLSNFLLERHALEKDFDPAQVRKARRAYLGSVSYIDDQLGRLQAVLERTKLDADTVVILLGDHGEMLGERGLWFKRHFFEWSARVPMIFSAPGRFAPAESMTNATLADLLPTLLSLGGDTALESLVEPVEGRNLAPILRGEAADVDDVAYAEVMSDGLSAPIFMLRRGDWKLIWGPEYPAQLFNVVEDPDERVDRSRTEQDACGALIEEACNVWDTEAIQRDVDLSIARRLLIRRAHDVGARPDWDFTPTQSHDRWCRTGTDYNAWAYTVLNPR